MKKIASNSFSGGINTVTARELIPDTMVEYMLNCNVLSTAVGNAGIVTNVKGNVLIETTLPEGENLCIGTAVDEEKNNFYYAVWNSEGFHTWFRFNEVERKIQIVMQSITDTGGIDILRWEKNKKILMADVVQNNLLYWVDGVDARKLNIAKCMDKTATGYGTEIKEEYINAYKLPPDSAPTVTYVSDAGVNVNRMYGALRKFVSRDVFDDGERSNWSDLSNVPLPEKESFLGVNTIPTENNRIDITVPTGSRIVKQIEIAMQYTKDGGFSSWELIITLDKAKLNIPDNSQYTYAFFNDGSYPTTNPEKIVRPYSFLPKNPLVQAVTRNVMIYGNFKAGFEDVPLNVSMSTTYTDLAIEDAVENKMNEPEIIAETSLADYIGGTTTFPESITRLDGSIYKIKSGTLNPNGPRKANLHKITIGHDVKDGNIFKINGGNGSDKINIEYRATRTDTSLTVVNQLRKKIIDTGFVYLATPKIPATNVYDNDTDFDGNTSFSFILMSSRKQEYIGLRGAVNPVSYNSLKDTGESKRNMKMGSTTKYGIVYEDAQRRRSLVYTHPDLIVKTASQNEKGGIKLIEHTLSIMHRPPVWAVGYQIARTKDLTFDHFIQMLVQKVIDVPVTDIGEYQDLLVGSLFTYQKIHPNTTLKYEFKKGDRLRAIKNQDNVYYDFFETEILDYNPTVEDIIDSNVAIDGTDIVTVDAASADNIGKFIVIDANEREILDAPTATTYQLKSPVGKISDSETFLSYKVIDRRGSVRIRKPAGVTLTDNSLFEIFTPSLSGGDFGAKQFFYFNKKFPIINAGMETRAHYANGQSQDGTSAETLVTTPAEVKISEGTIYVRSREMPLTNIIPGAQVDVDVVEDPSFSDFYFSLINDNGKVNAEDTGDGEVHFGSRLVFSNNYIEDTRINGLNDFDNLDREDYNDKYGDIMRLLFKENRLYGFKELKDMWIPVFQSIMQDTNEQKIVGISSKLLNQMQYFSYEGGTGNNPESVAVNANWIYHVMPNAGVIVRIGGSGIEPISELYHLDNEVRGYLLAASKYKARIYCGYDRVVGVLVVAIEGYKDLFYANRFDESAWQIMNEPLADNATYEILTYPTNGTLDITDPNNPVYTGNLTFSGNDHFTYRAFVDGSWTEARKVCLTVVPMDDPLAWRAKESSYSCVLDGDGLRTGYKSYATLERFGQFSGTANGEEKPNVVGDFNYVEPVWDEVLCAEDLPDSVPDPFNFTDLTGLGVSTLTESDILTPTGYNMPANISISNGEYRINGGTWTVSAGTINPGDTVQLRRITSSAYNTALSATLTIGGVSDNWSVRTRVALMVPVSYSVDFGLNPITHNALIFTRKGVEVFRTGSEGAGILTGIFFEGDLMVIRQFSYYGAIPWENSSNANLRVLVNSVERFNGNISVQDTELQNDTFTIAEGTSDINVISTGSSAAIGYVTKFLNTTSNTTLASLIVTDTTPPKEVLEVSSSEVGLHVYPYNLFVDANTQTLRVTNSSPTYSMDVIVNAGSVVTIPASSFHDFTGIVKDSIDVNITLNLP